MTEINDTKVVLDEEAQIEDTTISQDAVEGIVEENPEESVEETVQDEIVALPEEVAVPVALVTVAMEQVALVTVAMEQVALVTVAIEPEEQDAIPSCEEITEEKPKAEVPEPVPTTENELKRAINKKRQDIDHHDNLIRKAINEAKHHRSNVNELKAKRDEINAKVRKSASEASKIRKDRDEINTSIDVLKVERDGFRREVSKIAENIRQLKINRDGMNKDAKGSTTGLRRFYVLDVETLLNADIPLKHEINLFDGIMGMHGRIDLSHKADDIHGEVTTTYKSLNELSKKSDNIHRRVQELAKESQAKHEVMVDMYREIDKLRKEANDYHRQVMEKYAVIKPLSESIDANKVTIKRLRAELAEYIDKMDDIHKDKVKGKQDKDRVVAKEKLKKTGKMSLDDLRLLLEGNELNL